MISLEDLTEFIKEQKIPVSEEITLDTYINEDLLVVGDDAEEFLQEFMKKYNVKLDNLVFSEYFPDEATSDMQYYLLAARIKKYPHSIFSVVRKLEVFLISFFITPKKYKPLSFRRLIEISQPAK